MHLIVGRPGVGKTTLIKDLSGLLGERAGGFYTEEIRQHGQRIGFRLITLDGEETILASVSSASTARVGKYGVEVGNLDRVGVAALRRAIAHREVIIIDEIGRMELHSHTFRTEVEAAFASGRVIVATAMLAPHPFVDRLKQRPDVRLWTLERGTYAQVSGQLRESLGG